MLNAFMTSLRAEDYLIPPIHYRPLSITLRMEVWPFSFHFPLIPGRPEAVAFTWISSTPLHFFRQLFDVYGH